MVSCLGHLRLNLLVPEIVIILFHLSDQSLCDISVDSFNYGIVYAAQKVVCCVENIVMHKIHRVVDPQNMQFEQLDYEALIEVIIFIEYNYIIYASTLYRIYAELKPYSMRDEDESARIQAKIMSRSMYSLI